MDTKERFLAKVTIGQNSGCWIWTASIGQEGYGRFGIKSLETGKFRIIEAHRVSYELFIGPILNGLELDHLCRVRACVNPAHLEPVTHKENCRRGETGQHYGRLKASATTEEVY